MGSVLNTLRETVTDALIRKRARRSLCVIRPDEYRISVARSIEDHREAFRLVQIAYSWLGIEPVAGPELRMTPQHVLPESTIFVARDKEGHLVGTMTVTLDSAAGLPLDKDYPEEVAALRHPLRRLVEFGSLAVVARCKGSGVSALLTMAAYYFSIRRLRATDVVIGVHPKASALYRALYNFAPLAPARDHAQLIAPVQGMAQDLTTFEAWLRPRFRVLSAEGRPIHEHFFDTPPSCVEMPPVTDLLSLARWKLPRSVFRRVFIEGSDRIQTLDTRTRSQLSRWRSPLTTDDVPLPQPQEALA